MSKRCSNVAHIHLDLVGGMAGDMFVSAMLDAWPALESVLADGIVACALPNGWHTVHDRRITAGMDARTFDVRRPSDGEEGAGKHVAHGHDSHQHRHDHDALTDRDAVDHTHVVHDSGRYSEIAARIDAMSITDGARRHAQGIYLRLAECESAMHGVPVADVHFHELADWDSVVDIVSAGVLIDALGTPAFSVGSVPLGGGMVRTAHGPLPVPAPATARLLEGFAVRDDGIGGERVTPTGAAILAWLAPLTRPTGWTGTLCATGMGAGQRELDGCANVLRVLGFSSDDAPSLHREPIAELTLDVDDQTPEDLAAAVDELRAAPGVLDVMTRTGLGKKGRVAMELRVMCVPAVVDAVASACLAQTTSLGVRVQHLERRVVARSSREVQVDGRTVSVKVAERPDGTTTAKAEHDEVRATARDQRERRAIAIEAEQRALGARARNTNNNAIPGVGPNAEERDV